MGSIRLLLTNGQATLIDRADLPRILPYEYKAVFCGYKWYAYLKVDGKTVYLHRFLMDAPEGMEVDHIDGDTLNNQRSNLRVCSHAQNLANQQISAANTSGYKGVSYCRARDKWEAYIKYQQRKINLGRYPTAEEAARVYDRKASELFGDFARLNFPTD